MNIRFLSLKLENFMSFSEAEVKLNNQSYTLVSGINNNPTDLAKSNGSGKSSIWEAIVWALTGETIRGTKKVVNRYTQGGTSVELVFSLDNDQYKIIRYKDHKEWGTNLKIYINNQDKSGKGIRDTEKLLNDYLPDLTASLIGSVIILGQGLPQRFTNNTPSGRKEVLEKLSKSDFMINDIKDKLFNRRTYLNNELRKYEDLILSDESKKSMLDKRLQELKETKASLVPIDYESEIKKYQNQLEEITNLQVDSYNKTLYLQKEIENKLEQYANYNKVVEGNVSNVEINLQETYKTAELNETILGNKFKARALDDKIKTLDSVKDTCPTCGQHLPDIHKVDTSDLKAELNELLSQITYQETNYKEITTKIQNLVQEARDEFNKDLTKLKSEGSKLREELNLETQSLTKFNNEISSLKLTINKLELNKAEYERRVNTIDNEIITWENELKTYNDKLLYNNIEKDNIQKHLDIVSKMITIATRDFRGYLLSEVISYINLKSKEYCKDIFETDKIDFSLDGNNINITYCDKEYENLSGGEKQKIDLIIQFSIRDMLSQFLSFSSNILVLDEIFDNLDAIGCQKVLNLISNKLTDIESIFIITHHTDIDIPADNCLTIFKDINGISRV